MFKMQLPHRNKTIKNRNTKDNLWEIFDSEIVKLPVETIEKDLDSCEQCKTRLFVSDEGFLTCSNNKCAIVFKDIVDQTAEWRYYGADDNHHSDPTRCGMPINPLLEESSYGCKVLSFYGSKMTYEMRKIKRYTEWQSMPYKEKAQYDEFQKITLYANSAGIPKCIIDDAIVYHKKISEYDQTFRGDNKDGLLLGSIYMSCRINNYPRTAKELAVIFNVNVPCATKGCKIAQVILNDLEKNTEKTEKTTFEKTTPISFIQRYCSKLNINSEQTKICEFVCIKIESQNLMPENSPHSIAAGVIYFIVQLCQLNISKKDIKSVSKISEVTINKCYKKMDKKKETLIPKIILDKYNV